LENSDSFQLSLLPAQLPLRRQPPRRLDDGASTVSHSDCESYHRIETWYAFIDIVTQQICKRFSQDCFGPVENIEALLVRAAQGQTFHEELTQTMSFYDDFDHDALQAQLRILSNIFHDAAPCTVLDVAKKLKATEGSFILLSEIVRLTKLALVVPATSASAERSFSALRRLKTYLRSSTGQSRLNHLLLLNCHQERVDKLNIQNIAQDFVRACETRLKFFGNFPNCM
jgi:hypothetical protein